MATTKPKKQSKTTSTYPPKWPDGTPKSTDNAFNWNRPQETPVKPAPTVKKRKS